MTNGNDPINPSIINEYSGNAQMGDVKVISPGLSKREHFAAIAMQGILSDQSLTQPNQSKIIAAWAIKCADALIEALNNTQQS